MTDRELSTPILEEAPIPADFNLDDWIDGGAVTEHSVAIYSRPDLAAVIEDWERRRKIAKVTGGGDASLGEPTLESLEEEGRRIYKQWIDSKATWYIRALEPSRIDEIRAAGKTPEAIKDLPGSPDPAALAKHQKRQAKRAEEITAAVDEVNLNMLAESVIRIEGANGGVQQGVTVEQLRRMRERLGQRQVNSLLNAATLAVLVDPELKPDFSQATSKRDPA